MSFRRSVLEELGGFDEHIEYIWDETDLALHLLDAGWRLAPLDGAAVHHKFLPSHLRRGRGEVFDPYVPVKNRTYFALRNGPGHRTMEEIFRSLSDYADLLRATARDAERHGRFTAAETRSLPRPARGGVRGRHRARAGSGRAGRTLTPRDEAGSCPTRCGAPRAGGSRSACCRSTTRRSRWVGSPATRTTWRASSPPRATTSTW